MQGDVVAAERHFTRAVELDPGDASAQENLARARELLGIPLEPMNPKSE
jgi:Flp pilus assembly protein TadD